MTEQVAERKLFSAASCVVFAIVEKNLADTLKEEHYSEFGDELEKIDNAS